ncbi:MAG: sortase [Candidatus Aquicultor sp.]
MNAKDTAKPHKKTKKAKTKRSGHNKLSTLLIVVGIIVIIIPFVTEIYGYFEARKLTNAWEVQAKDQRTRGDKIKTFQDELVASGQLPQEDSIIDNSKLGKSITNKKDSERKKPFPKTRIRIPKIGVDQVILEGVGPEILQYGPGHYVGSCNPGERGNVGIAGHRVTYTHPFNRLDELSNGDTVILETVDFIYEYQVENMMVTDPKNVSNLQPTSDPRVTLTTCNPKYSAKTRLNVIGVLINTKPQRVNIVRAVKQIKEIFKTEKTIEKIRFDDKPKTTKEYQHDLKAAQKAINKNPLDGNAYILMSRSCLGLEKYAESYQALKKAELIQPDSVEVQRMYRLIEIKKKQLEGEVRTAESLTASNGLNPMPYFELGRMCLATENYEEAAQAFKNGSLAAPYAADMYAYQALAYEKMKRDDLAVTTYNLALRFDPTYPEAVEGLKRVQGGKSASGLDVNSLPYKLRPQ